MRPWRRYSPFQARRLLGIALALTFVIVLEPGARAVTKGQVEAAKARVAELQRQIEAEQADLSRLESQAGALAARLSAAEGQLQRIGQELAQTRGDLAAARDEYEATRARLDDRARQAYMNGPANGIEFVLGATSLADLTDGVEFLSALSRSDSDLASQVQNLKVKLTAREHQEQALRGEQARVVQGLRADRARLDGQLAAQRSILADIDAKEREAEQTASAVSSEYRQQLAASFGGPIGDGPIEICPVAQPRGFGDDFGAPRYTGGYHPHAGNDIFAPTGTPIYAPFDGYAYEASNSLGGLSVIVRGSLGYVYNAHLSRFGQLGNVSTGDVIGYVGATGDASTPHDHFEWHPNVIPSNWPESRYAYSVISSAINPRPLLLQVC